MQPEIKKKKKKSSVSDVHTVKCVIYFLHTAV